MPNQPQSRGGKAGRLSPRGGYTLIELLITIVIIAILAVLSFTAFGRMRDKARAVTALAALKQVGSLQQQYAAENSGAINTITSADATQPSRHFWGRFQSYFAGDFPAGWNSEINVKYKQAISQLLGTSDASTMAGTAFAGAKIYHDTRGLPVPFTFNNTGGKMVDWSGIAPKRLSAFPDPGQTLYTCFGWGTFTAAEGAIHADYPTDGKTNPSGAQRIYALPNKKVLACFLDGRTEFLDRPFDPLYYGQTPP
jgi:prepilin-type N-terminal cleavage/methylation domain-containing protein